jgi:hypothetical protein
MKRRRERKPRQSYLFIFTGLLAGLVAGLAVAWLFFPVSYYDLTPASLNQEEKEQYRSLVAQAYLVNEDIGRARARLTLLKDENPTGELLTQAKKMAENGDATNAKSLQILASDLERLPQPTPGGEIIQTSQPTRPAQTIAPNATLDPNLAIMTATLSPTPTITLTPTQTLTPLPTLTPRPSPTVQAVPAIPFTIKSIKKECEARALPGQIRIEVVDKEGNPMPGVRISVTWNGGEDTFYTGLHPEESPGFADFSMLPGLAYRVRAGEGGEISEELRLHTCTSPDSTTFDGSYRIVFTP